MKVGVLISGEGTNLQALIDAPDIDLACVVSSRDDAPGVQRARRARLPVATTRDEPETNEFLESHGVELVVLAGYMRILSDEFVGRWSGRILNVHPSLLPAFPGLDAVGQAVAHGVRVTGVTVHLVDAEHSRADSGPIVLQEAMAVSYDQPPAEVAERLHELEHRLLPAAVRLFAAGRIEVHGRRVQITG
ncbi:MAG: phosphoribosylglycinamide formyltransferase [Gaiellales bacterium]